MVDSEADFTEDFLKNSKYRVPAGAGILMSTTEPGQMATLMDMELPKVLA